MKEGKVKIEIGQLGNEDLDTLELDRPMTIKDVAEIAGIKYNRGTEIQVNMEEVSDDYVVRNGDIIIFVPNVEGGRR